MRPTVDESKYAEEPVAMGSTVRAIFTSQGFVKEVKGSVDTIGLVLDESPFYAEAGGQVADRGTITFMSSKGHPIVLDVIDVQTYGGFLLHTCIAPSEMDDLDNALLSVGMTVQMTVDSALRRRVAPNHTMTHVLNFALREVLGEGVDQKGSSVNEERLRFDFSHNRGLSVEEIQRIESIVNKVITAELPVDTKVVPLKDALSVSGLRAVFGEVYPDPVRVVSVGQQVAHLVSNPANAEWGQYSIEFCGGTHLSNTRDAKAFVVVEETAVAKGIRRITGITGAAAVDAVSKGVQLKSRVEHLSARMALKEDLNTLEEEVSAERAALEMTVLSQALKSLVRNELEGMQKQLSFRRSAELLAAVDLKIEGIKAHAKKISSEGKKAAVFRLDIGSDAKAIKRAIDSIKAVAPELSFMCVSTETDKVTCFAVRSPSGGSLKANEWVSQAVTVGGGRGGGRDSQAQGSISDPSKVDALIKEAEKYAAAAVFV